MSKRGPVDFSLAAANTWGSLNGCLQYEGYDLARDLWWWEGVIQLRKVALVAIVSLEAQPEFQVGMKLNHHDESSCRDHCHCCGRMCGVRALQALMLLITLFIFLCLHVATLPFEQMLPNYLEAGGLVVLTASQAIMLGSNLLKDFTLGSRIIGVAMLMSMSAVFLYVLVSTSMAIIHTSDHYSLSHCNYPSSLLFLVPLLPSSSAATEGCHHCPIHHHQNRARQGVSCQVR